MLAVKRFVPSLLGLLFISCGQHDSSYQSQNSDLAKVSFFNESSYSISINLSSFGGPLLVDRLSPGGSFSATLSPSGNHGLGSVFSVWYWYPVATEGLESGNVWTGGIDPDMQITRNIESGKNYNIQIPNPLKLELQEAFIKIMNASDTPIEFMSHANMSLRQAGSGEIYIQSGKIGVYNFDSRTSGIQIESHLIKQGMMNFYAFPELRAESGWIYSYEFNDGIVKQIGVPQNLVF